MELTLPRHVQRGMELYHISEEEVRAILAYPVVERPNKEGNGRREAWGNIGERWIMVVYVPGGDRTVLVTVIPKRRGAVGSLNQVFPLTPVLQTPNAN